MTRTASPTLTPSSINTLGPSSPWRASTAVSTMRPLLSSFLTLVRSPRDQLDRLLALAKPTLLRECRPRIDAASCVTPRRRGHALRPRLIIAVARITGLSSLKTPAILLGIRRRRAGEHARAGSQSHQDEKLAHIRFPLFTPHGP